MTVESPARDIVAIQMLRGIAATMVVFVHLDTQLSRLHHARLGSAWLATGVDIFFVISGFIMWTSVERRSGVTAGAFLKNRIIRIVPLYWFVTTMVVLVALLAPQLLRTTTFSPGHVLASYFFVPARHPTVGLFLPVVIPGWSLNYEMLFYLVFAAAIMMTGEKRGQRFVAIAAMLVLIIAIASLTSGRIDVMNFYKNPILLEFLAGVVLGIVCRSGLIRRSRLWLGAAFLGFLLLWAGSRFGGGFPLVFVAASLIVAGAVFAPPLPHNAVSALGDASYSLYLTHTIVLAAVGLLWAHLFANSDYRLFIGCAVSMSIVVAFAMYLCFEMPVTSKLKAISSTRRRTAPSADAVPSSVKLS